MDRPPRPEVVEYAARLERERRKAREKYGEAALAPGGHPDKDVLDYLINELVGLNRYAQMLEHRCREVELLIRQRPVREAARDGVGIARRVFALGGQLALELIEVRRRLRAAGLALGEPEHPPSSLPELAPADVARIVAREVLP